MNGLIAAPPRPCGEDMHRQIEALKRIQERDAAWIERRVVLVAEAVREGDYEHAVALLSTVRVVTRRLKGEYERLAR